MTTEKIYENEYSEEVILKDERGLYFDDDGSKIRIKKDELCIAEDEEVVVGKTYRVYIQSIIKPTPCGILGNFVKSAAFSALNSLIIENEAAEAAGEEITTVDVDIIGLMSGGLICEFDGVRGFLPAKELSNFVDDLNTLVGQTIDVVPIEVGPNQDRLVFSEKKFKKYNETKKIKEKISELNSGDIVEAEIVRITPIGFFCIVDKTLFGLVHKSEISWSFVRDPNDFGKIGDKIKALIKSVDHEKNRVELSIKLLEKNPKES